jgi:hypothetical protein
MRPRWPLTQIYVQHQSMLAEANLMCNSPAYSAVDPLLLLTLRSPNIPPFCAIANGSTISLYTVGLNSSSRAQSNVACVPF